MTKELSSGHLLWTPDAKAAQTGQLADFADMLRTRSGFDWGGDFQALWRWSVENDLTFWDIVWDWHGVIGDKGTRIIENEGAMPGEFYKICESMEVFPHKRDKTKNYKLAEKTSDYKEWFKEK